MSIQHLGSNAMQTGRQRRILLVEDDLEFCNVVKKYLETNDFDVHMHHRGETAVREVEALAPDMVLLDVMLPGMDGLEVCKQLRSAKIRVPIIMLTAREDEIDQVLGLELGADDYLPKPIKPRLLVARMKAVFRRYHDDSGSDEEEIMVFGRLTINCVRMMVTVGDTHIHMTPAEFDLLRILAASAGKVVQRRELLLALRGLHSLSADRSIDARLYRLRRRFDDDAIGQRIRTVRPNGYMFTKEDW
jgi:DNA-binding response OmpR family regulator